MDAAPRDAAAKLDATQPRSGGPAVQQVLDYELRSWRSTRSGAPRELYRLRGAVYFPSCEFAVRQAFALD